MGDTKVDTGDNSGEKNRLFAAITSVLIGGYAETGRMMAMVPADEGYRSAVNRDRQIATGATPTR